MHSFIWGTVDREKGKMWDIIYEIATVILNLFKILLHVLML